MFEVTMTPKHIDHTGKTHHRTHLGVASLHRVQASKRRSNRMALQAPVGLTGEDRQKSSFTLSAKATNLNRHGAAVQLNRDLPVGTVVMLKNQRGAQISARVVALLAAREGMSTYGLEFVEQDDKAQDFWGISFPSTGLS